MDVMERVATCARERLLAPSWTSTQLVTRDPPLGRRGAPKVAARFEERASSR
jgi:hypothetical protein